MYISKEGFDRIAAENEITPEMLAQELNLTDAYDEAKNSNKIQAGMADWIVNSKEAEKKFGKDFSKKFSDDITLDPQEFSVNETKQYIAENAQAAQESVKEAIEAGEIEQKDFDAAKSFVKNQLNQVYKSENFTDSQWTNAIDKQADVMAAMIVQEARKRKTEVSDFAGNMNMPAIKTKLSQRQQNNRELAADIYGRIKGTAQDKPLTPPSPARGEGERREAAMTEGGSEGKTPYVPDGTLPPVGAESTRNALKDLLESNLNQFKKKYQKLAGKRLNDRDAQDVHYFLLRQAADEGIEAPQAAYAMHKLKAADMQNFKTEFEDASFNEGTLNQPMLDGIDIQEQIPVLDLSEEEFDNNTPIAEQIKNKLNSLAGQKLTTATENRLIDIIGSDRKKHLRKSSRFRFLKRNPDAKERRDANLLSIDRLVNNSVLIEIAPNTKTTEKPNVEFYHYFYTPVRIGKDTYTVRLVAEQMKGETGIAPEAVHLYDVIEVSPEANRQNGSLLSGDTISIAEMLANVKDADGKPYIDSDMFLQGPADITRTAAFKKWFGDWENDPQNASKVVDGEGRPLVIYHNTTKSFNKFDLSKARQNSDIPAFFFSSEKGEWADMGNIEMPVYLSIKKPYTENYVDYKGLDRDFKAIRRELIKDGYDGIMIEEDGRIPEYIAFHAEQIKSVDNRGTFDADNANIYFQETSNKIDNLPAIIISKEGIKQEEAQAALSALAGKDIINKSTGIAAQINSKQKSKLVSAKSVSKSIENGFTKEQHFEAASRINESFENAILLEEGTDKNNDINIKSIRRFVAPVKLGEDTNYSYMLIKESVEHGNRIYTTELINKKGLESILDTLKNKRTPVSSPNNSIPEKGEKSKGLFKRAADWIGDKINVLLQGKRGAYNPATNTIYITPDSDASTILHEFSHYFLKERWDYILSGQADEAYIKDFAPIKQYLAIEDGQKELTSEQQEKFADAFEAYLAAGEAPSAQLKKAFEALKKWMLRIYGEIKAKLGLELPKEVRNYFDAMLASEAEIEQMNAELAPQIEIEGRTEEEKKAAEFIATAWEKARRTAAQKLFGKKLEAQEEARNQEYFDEEAAFEEKTLEELSW